MRPSSRVALAALALAASACGEHVPAPHPAPARAVSLGGPVMKSPRLHPVFFSNEDPAFRKALEDFTSRLGATDYWAQTTGEYGVGPALAGAPVELGEAPPATISSEQIRAWLAARLTSQDPAFPVVDADTLLVLFYPPGVTVTSTDGAVGCDAFLGFHTVISVAVGAGAIDVPLAVIPRCATYGKVEGIDVATAAASHEIVEAATDPRTSWEPAWSDVDADHRYWATLVEDLEVADLCALDGHAIHTFPELPYAVQRTWSNAAAAAGHDPCVPALPDVPYFNAVPVLPDTITISRHGDLVPTKGVQIPVGGKKTIDLALFSEESTGGSWNVQVADYASLGGHSPRLGLTLDRSQGDNGDTLHLTIEVLDPDPSGLDVFLVDSSQGQARWHTEMAVVGR